MVEFPYLYYRCFSNIDTIDNNRGSYEKAIGKKRKKRKINTGYTLSDEANHVYTFPDGFALNTGSTVTVHTGSGADTQNELYWRSGSPI